MSEIYLGLDLGTTGCKCVACDEQINLLGENYSEYPLHVLSPEEIEQDINDWWQVAKDTIKGVIADAKLDPKDIKGISLSTQGISFAPVDENMQPLRRAFCWLDTRTGEQIAQIHEKIDPMALYDRAGIRMGNGHVLPHLLWLRQNEPQVWEKTKLIMMPHDYILYKLSGKVMTNYTMAAGTILYDVRKAQWSDETLAQFDIPKSILPPIYPAGTAAGPLLPSVAQELGLPEDCLVSVGGQDQKVAAYGGGIDPETVTISLGTASALTRLMDAPHMDSISMMSCCPYLFSGQWELEGVISTACACLKWLRDTLFPNMSYNEMNHLAQVNYQKAPEVFFSPNFSKESAFGVSAGAFRGLSLNTTAGDMIRALFEGIAFQIRSHIETLERISGPVTSIRLFGGGSKSELWPQIIADVLNKPVAVPFTAETGGIGAAILAIRGCGKSFSRSVIKDRAEFTPNPTCVALYEKAYPLYMQWSQASDTK